MGSKAKCEATIYMGYHRQCTIEDGHDGKHRCTHESFNATAEIQWEGDDREKCAQCEIPINEDAIFCSDACEIDYDQAELDERRRGRDG